MAIVINTTPDGYEPVYTNSISFDIQSTFQAQINFKYLFDVYIKDTGSSVYNFINRILVYPNPVARGFYSPHLILQANNTSFLQHNISAITKQFEAARFYRLNFGENYNPNRNFSDTFFSGGFLGLTFSTSILSDFIVGDLIIINKDSVVTNPQYNGTASITSIVTNNSILTNIPQGTTQSNESGKIIDVLRVVATSSNFVSFNGARQDDEWNINYGSEYAMSGSQSFLSAYKTNYTDNLIESYPIYGDDYATLDFIIATAAIGTFSDVYCTYYYYDSANTLLGTDVISISTDDESIRFIAPSGTKNIDLIAGSGSQFLQSGLLNNYEINISLGDSGGPIQLISKTYSYSIISNCRPYDVIRLAFLNKLGGFDYWNFNLVSKYTSNISRTQIMRYFNKNISTFLKRGRDVIYSKAVENWTINSDFLTDDQAIFIRELVESSDIYIIDGDTQIPIVLTSDNYEFKSGLLNGYVQYTLSFVKSSDVYINR